MEVSEADAHSKSLASVQFPLSRVKRLVKYDPGVTLVSWDAIFLISKAAELFVHTLAKESHTYTTNETKKTMMKRHVVAAINEIDALSFLDGVID